MARSIPLFLLMMMLDFPMGFSRSGRAIIYSTETSSPVNFSTSEIGKALKSRSIATHVKNLADYPAGRNNIRIVLARIDRQEAMEAFHSLKLELNTDIKEEGFCIRVSKDKIPSFWILAKDDAGLMYGGFELAELITTGGLENIKDQEQNPYMKMRGTKFNIPLDVRTPSYSDFCDAGQKNIAEMWNFDFWKEYIDSLARYRYNFISLWSLHPFPSLVKVPEYPEVALADVHRSTHRLNEFYSLNGHGFDDPDVVTNFEVIKKMSIDEKIDFWRKVMAYGKNRNVDFYVVTWNIFTYGVDGKYGITDKVDNPVTRDYFRKSVSQLLRTYPDLAGVGLTTGENMYGLSTEVKEDWAFETYGLGVLDVANEQPDRKITLIHRQHQTGALEIAKRFSPLSLKENVNFVFSFKYAQAHVYSSVNQVFHQKFVEDIRKDKELKTIWTLRNDDIYFFRWGAPDFVRDFIKNIPYEVSDGYYYGSDNYIWGREFLTKDVEGPREIEIAKHWYHWMMWGRLGYNPDMDNERFISMLQKRYSPINSRDLFDAWQNASMIYPLVTGFHWGALDFQWYIESGKSRSDPARTPSGYHDVNRFISLPPHQGAGNLSIPDYVENVLSGSESKNRTPLDLAAEIINRSEMAMEWAMNAKAGDNPELFNTINDIKSMAYLGKYYAHKIIAATHLALFRKTYNPEFQSKLLEELEKSAMYWRYYASNSLYLNTNPLWTNRVGNVDWKEIYQWALYDLTANGGNPVHPSMEPTPGGTILEAEDAEFSSTHIRSEFTGFTGRGYLESSGGDAKQRVKWTFTSQQEGKYAIEIRYSLKRQEEFVAPLTINGEEAGKILFWSSGGPRNWVWDKQDVVLQKGVNHIEIGVEGFVLFDHINLIKK